MSGTKFKRPKDRFSQLLRSRREALMLTREEFANLVGMSEDYLADLEIRRKKPSLQMLKKLVLGALAPSAADVPRFIEKESWQEIDLDVALAMILTALQIDPALFRRWIPLRAVKPGTVFITKAGERGIPTGLPDTPVIGLTAGDPLILDEETPVFELKVPF